MKRTMLATVLLGVAVGAVFGQDVDSDNDGLDDAQELTMGTNPANWDSDFDGMPDGWEERHGLLPLEADEWQDFDSDGIANLQEYLGRDGEAQLADADFGDATSPTLADTDGDRMPDGYEYQWLLNPLVADAHFDADGDGLSNRFEMGRLTNPQRTDTDGDGLPDAWEVAADLDPLDAAWWNGANGDPDFDGLTNAQEFSLRDAGNLYGVVGIDGSWSLVNGANPKDADTDKDGMPDGWEFESRVPGGTFYLNPLDGGLDDDGNPVPGNLFGAAGDPDNDGYSNLEEYERSWNPWVSDQVAGGVWVSLDDGAPPNVSAMTLRLTWGGEATSVAPAADSALKAVAIGAYDLRSAAVGYGYQWYSAPLGAGDRTAALADAAFATADADVSHTLDGNWVAIEGAIGSVYNPVSDGTVDARDYFVVAWAQDEYGYRSRLIGSANVISTNAALIAPQAIDAAEVSIDRDGSRLRVSFAENSQLDYRYEWRRNFGERLGEDFGFVGRELNLTDAAVVQTLADRLGLSLLDGDLASLVAEAIRGDVWYVMVTAIDPATGLESEPVRGEGEIVVDRVALVDESTLAIESEQNLPNPPTATASWMLDLNAVRVSNGIAEAQTIVIGGRANADNGYENGQLDVETDSSASWWLSEGLESAHPALAADMRPLRGDAAWYLHASFDETPESFVIRWNMQLPEDVSLVLAEVDPQNGYAPIPGTREVAMAFEPELAVDVGGIAPGTRKVFRVTLGRRRITHVVRLYPGWNLVSLPIDPEVDSPEAVLSDGHGLKYFRTVVELSRSGANSRPVYKFTTRVRGGIGYWINSNFRLEDTPTNPATGQPQGYFDIPVIGHTVERPWTLYRGWNLVGVGWLNGAASTRLPSAIHDQSAGAEVAHAYFNQYDNAAKGYGGYRVIGASEVITDLEIGRGYYIYSKSYQTLMLR